MGIGIQPVGKKIINPGTAILARRQTDTMDNDQGNLAALRSIVAIWRQYTACIGQPGAIG
jgi:hypothetical protein